MYYVIGVIGIMMLALIIISLENVCKFLFDIKSALLSIERKLDEDDDFGE